jgi:transcriptional repressor NrdR
MVCPACDSPTRVSETRSARAGAIRRRRHCPACGHRFTTFERLERGPLAVRKRDGATQRFDRVKLRAALLGAAHKRPVAAPDVERIVDRIEAEAEAAGGVIAAERIVELCLIGLRELDPGAYLQYAGTLPSFNTEIARSFPEGSVRLDREGSELPAEPTARERER